MYLARKKGKFSARVCPIVPVSARVCQNRKQEQYFCGLMK